jgi:hypothetical protein
VHPAKPPTAAVTTTTASTTTTPAEAPAGSSDGLQAEPGATASVDADGDVAMDEPAATAASEQGAAAAGAATAAGGSVDIKQACLDIKLYIALCI